MIRRIATLVLFGVMYELAFAQLTSPEKGDNPYIPTWETYEFMKYGIVGASLYTGTVNYSVPIYTYEDNDFKYTISVDYATNGFRVNHKSGPLGHGWSLSSPGIITREIHNIPDDCQKDIETKTAGAVGVVELKGFNQLPKENLIITTLFNFSDNNAYPAMMKVINENTKYYYDAQPDIYRFKESVSASSPVRQNFSFGYDPLDRLVSAEYACASGQTPSASDALSLQNERDYSCRYGYDLNGNMTFLHRRGVSSAISTDGKAIWSFGDIDNLNLSYSGNQLKKVTDQVEALTYAGAMDFKDRIDKDAEYEYDANGNLTRDRNKGIYSIAYNVLNLPQTVLFNDGHLTRYTYDADGRKLKTEYILSNFRFAEFEQTGPLDPVFKPMASPLPGGSGGHITIDKDRFPVDSAIYMGPKTLMTVEYCGNHIYRNGKLERILNDYGYYANGAYHFNITDYQGNIRAVVREDGTLEETSSYYPYGGLMGSGSMGVQPYKYGGKELDRENGLDLYDSHARVYDPIIGRTTTIDPLAEKYTHLSPYLWCAANPLKYVDRNGCSITAEIENKEYLIKKNNDTYKLYDKNGNNFIPEEFTFGDYLISDINHLAKSKEGSKIVEYIYNNDRNLTIKKGSSFSFNIAEDVLSYADGNGSQNGGLSSFLFSQLKPDRPHYIGLVHEMAHAEYAWKGFDNKDIWYKNNKVTAFKSELYTMYKENLVRMENNLPLRMFYEHQLIKIGNYDFIMPNWFSKVPLTIKNNIYLLNNLNRR